MWSFTEMSRHSSPCTQPKASWYICVVDLGFVAGAAEAQSSGKNCCTLGWEQVQSLTPGLEFAFLFWGDTKLNAGWGEQKGELCFCGIYVWKKDYCTAHFILITVSFGSGATVRTSAVIYFRSILISMPCNYATLPLVYALKLFALKGTNNKL